MRGLLVIIASVVCLGTAPLQAQPASQLKVTILVAERARRVSLRCSRERSRVGETSYRL